MTVAVPRLTLERRLLREHALVIACDEVGRGALAGPVAVGAAVVDARALRRLYDSEGLSSVPAGDVGSYGSSSDAELLDVFRQIDRNRHPKRYPMHVWKVRRADTSIDHRRMPNLYSFIRYYLKPLPTLADSVKKRARFEPGDLVFWVAPGGGDYPGMAGIVTDRRDREGVPRVVTLAKVDLRMTDTHRLTDWRVMGHFRVDPDALLEKFLTQNTNARLQPR